MANVHTIIGTIDEYLTKAKKKYIGPVEANALLARKGILADSDLRPGLPLRKLLRADKLPHAYQVSGKDSEWVIPYSSNKSGVISNYSSAFKIKNTSEEKTNEKKSNLPNPLEWKNKIEEARLKYKPKNIEILLIAESPPDNIERFFYFPSVSKHDDLFLGIAKALYPTLKEYHLLKRREKDCSVKELILEKLKQDGLYLIDLSDLPLFLITNLEAQVPSLILKINSIINNRTKIILISSNVYDKAYLPLIKAGIKNIIDCRITFPGNGGQKKFQIEFNKALKLADYI